MEALFRALEGKGKNTVDEIIQWLTKAKLTPNKDQQDKVKKTLANTSKNGKVEFAKFQETVMDCAKSQKLSAETATKQLTEAAGERAVADATTAATGAISGAANKAKDAFGGLFK